MSIHVEDASAAGALHRAPRAASAAGCARVLLALSSERVSARALPDAHAFAARLGAELHVIRVVSNLGSAESSAPRGLRRVVRDSHRVLAIARHMHRACEHLFEDRHPGTRVCVRLGAFLEQVAQRASELDAKIIIVARRRKRIAPSVLELARRTECGVLVLRGPVAGGSLIVATDLGDSETAVLRKASQLGRELQAGVLAVHSVSVTRDGDARLEQVRQRLEHATGRVATQLEPLVLQALAPADGILREARARGVGLIIVGARSRQQRTAPSTAARLIEKANASVLVEPLDDDELGGARGELMRAHSAPRHREPEPARPVVHASHGSTGEAERQHGAHAFE